MGTSVILDIELRTLTIASDENDFDWMDRTIHFRVGVASVPDFD